MGNSQISKWSLFLLLAGIGLAISGLAQADRDSGENIVKRGTVTDDYYVAGGTVDVDATVAGDVLACGGEVKIAGSVDGDLMVCGGQQVLTARVADDLRAVGGDIIIDSGTGDDLLAAGGSISVTSASSIGGDAWLAGGEVSVAGTINQDLMVAAGSVRISGIIKGNVEIQAGDVEITDSAVIDGELNYLSPDPARIDENASIRGTVTHTEVDWEQDGRGFGIFFFLTLLVAASVLFLLFPGFTEAATRRMSSDPWRSIGIGIVFLIITPLIAIVLMAIVLGIWVGLSLLALYLLALLIGYLVAIFFVGDWIARLIRMDVGTKGKRILSAFIAIILLALLQFIPVIGGIVVFILLLFGFGAVLGQIYANYRRDAATALST